MRSGDCALQQKTRCVLTPKLLEDVARLLAPGTVDARRREDPSFFQRLTVDGWRIFFMNLHAASAGQSWTDDPLQRMQTLNRRIRELTAANTRLEHELALFAR